MSAGVLGLAAAALTLSCRALLAEAELPTLAWSLAAVGVAVVALVASRLLYRRRPVPAILAAWPSSSSLRRPALAVLTTLATLLAVTGFVLQLDDARDIAGRYGPGIVIVALGVAIAAVVASGLAVYLVVAMLAPERFS
jgi:K+-transporting ATPase KdpF subunit